MATRDTAELEPPIPPQLLVHLREGRLVLFAGAGMSAQAGLPTWGALIREVIEATVAEAMEGSEARAELEQMLGAGKWLQIADHCKVKLGPGGYARLLAERLADAGRPVPQAHRLAVRLPFAAWVTTNYDKLFERAYVEEHGGLPRTLTSLDTEALGRLLFDGAPFVLKAHGDLDKPDSLVFTSRDYRDLIHANGAFSAAFSAILLTHAVLFVGYSLSDPDFNLLLDRQLTTFRGFVPERYALMSGVGKVEEEYLWRVCHIRVLPYAEGQHEALPAFLRLLGARLQAGTEAAPRVAQAAIPATPLPARPAPPVRAPVESAEPLSLAIDWIDGVVHARLSDGPDLVAASEGPRKPWSAIAAGNRELLWARHRDGAMGGYSAGLARLLGADVIKALASALQARPERLLRLDLTREAERLPWELFAVGPKTLAEAAAVYRAPVGISADARGLPAIHSPLRALIVGDTKAQDPSLVLPGSAEESRRVAEELRRSGAEVRLLLGGEATYDALVEAFEALDPDVFHFAGQAWFDEREAYIELADCRVSPTIIRPWLTRRSPALTFLNSHFTAFLPPGSVGGGEGHEHALDAGLGGRPAFSDLAMHSGVGAFIGTFSAAIDDRAACEFAVSVYAGLVRGSTAAAALRTSRSVAEEQGSTTALLYCLYGEGGLRLVGVDGAGEKPHRRSARPSSRPSARAPSRSRKT